MTNGLKIISGNWNSKKILTLKHSGDGCLWHLKNSMQDYDWKSHKEIHIGASGSGKTFLAWERFSQEKARFKFIFDHKAMEFSRRYGVKPCFTKDEMLAII